MLGAMTRRRGTILALALATAVAGTGCVRTGEDAARHQARRTALQDAAALAAKVERLQFPQGGDPGTDEYEPPWTNAAMVRRIAVVLAAGLEGEQLRVSRKHLEGCQQFTAQRLEPIGPRRVVVRRRSCLPAYDSNRFSSHQPEPSPGVVD
jgi:hypothetical protein